MADRQIFYILEQATTKDLLQCQQNYYLGLSRMFGALIKSPALSGLECSPTAVPSLNVDVSAGEIYAQAETDVTSYGVAPENIPANPAIITKQGIYNGGTFSMPAPVTIGTSIKYLIQVAFEEIDNVNENRLFKVGGVRDVDTRRQDLAVVEVKASAPAPSPVTPTPDSGFIGAWVVTVAYGQTTITSGDIAQYPNAPFFGVDYGSAIQDMLTQTAAAATYAKRPNVGNNGYFAEGDGAATPVGTGGAIVNLVQGSGQNWIAGNVVTIPFDGIYTISVAMQVVVTTVSPDTINFYLRVNGGGAIANSSLTFTNSGTLPWQLNGAAALSAGNTIELFAIESIASGATVQISFLNIAAIAN